MMSDGHDPLDELEELLGHRFTDRDLLRQAVRHSSAASATEDGSYQRLEFLGDAVLNHAMAEILYHQFPDSDQGELTKMRAHVAQSDSLATKAAELGLDCFVELGPS